MVADTSRALYREARRRGQQAAAPKWLERCLQIRCALQVSGDMEVAQPGAGGAREDCSMVLSRCVLLLLRPG